MYIGAYNQASIIVGGLPMDVKKQQKGVFCVFLAAVLYSIGGLCIKLIPWNGMSINGGRTLVALFVIGGYLILTKHKIRFNRYI